ncbi:MAG: hypothetical protein LBT49_04145 [Prevotellaceae bacterium]|nr:hypothetical protein [Prevotellaceae bacterium]
MESTCIKNAKVSPLNATALLDDDAEQFNDDTGLSDADEWVTDAHGNVFDKNGKLVGYTWEAVRERLTRKMSEAYGVDFFKVDRMKEAGLLKEKDITNELLLSPEFKYEPYPGFTPTPPRKPVTNDPEWDAAMEEVIAALENDDSEIDEELEREIKRATEEAIAKMVAEDDWEEELENEYVRSKA